MFPRRYPRHVLIVRHPGILECASKALRIWGRNSRSPWLSWLASRIGCNNKIARMFFHAFTEIGCFTKTTCYLVLVVVVYCCFIVVDVYCCCCLLLLMFVYWCLGRLLHCCHDRPCPCCHYRCFPLSQGVETFGEARSSSIVGKLNDPMGSVDVTWNGDTQICWNRFKRRVCVCLILLLYRGMFWHIIYVSWDLVGTKSFVKIQRSKHYLEKILVWRMSLHRFFTIHDHGTSQGFIHVWMNHPFWKAAGYWRLQRRVPTLPVKPIKRGPGAPSLCQNWFPFLCWHKPLMLPWEYAPYACFTELTWRWGILRQFKCLSNGHQEKVSLLFSKESG